MKFKILKGTETYIKMCDLQRQMKLSKALMLSIAKRLGGKEVMEGSFFLAGDVTGIAFDIKPEGWKDTQDPGYYMPYARNTKACELLATIPKIPVSAINDIVGFRRRHYTEGGKMFMSRHPGFAIYFDVALLDVSSRGTTRVGAYVPPNADIIEILESEYWRLMEEGQKKLEKATA